MYTTTAPVMLLGLFFCYIFHGLVGMRITAVQAKSFDAPIKLLFPRALEEGDTSTPFSMLGLGDIVIPGIFVALILRYDALHASKYFRRCGSCLLTASVFDPDTCGRLMLLLRYDALHASKHFRRCSSCLSASLNFCLVTARLSLFSA